MENQEYLNQIAASSAPVNQSGKSKGFSLSGLLHSKIFLAVTIGIVAFIILAILGSVLSGNKTDSKTETIKLQLHVANTSDVITVYQPHVKSSILRSYSASLQTILSKTNSDLVSYLTAVYDYKESKNDNLTTEAAAEREELETTLFEAKINGNLDRVYAHQMAYEITKITVEESSLRDRAKDESLQAILDQSSSSLENLYNSFNDFSEANN